MSKTQLRKFIQGLDADDLRSLILDIYDARKEAKEYLDFFVNPDINAKLNKATDEINKELNRTRRRAIACRVSKIKAALKLFASYGPEDDMLINLYIQTLRALVRLASTYFLSDTFTNGVMRFCDDTLKLIDRKNLFDKYFPEVVDIVESVGDTTSRSRSVTAMLRETIEAYARTKAFS